MSYRCHNHHDHTSPSDFCYPCQINEWQISLIYSQGYNSHKLCSIPGRKYYIENDDVKAILSGADPEILKGGVHKILGSRIIVFSFYLVVASLWNFVLHYGVKDCIRVYVYIHRMKQYLLFWLLQLQNNFNNRIFSTICQMVSRSLS